MRAKMFGCLMLWMAGTCFGQEAMPLCPRHIETPDYPPIGRTAHITGKITLTVTIDADGNVQHVEATTDNPVLQAHPLLQSHAIENMQHWTFAKPPSAPYTLAIIYDYEFDTALPPAGGPYSSPSITKVKFDLPDHVTILTNTTIIQN